MNYKTSYYVKEIGALAGLALVVLALAVESVPLAYLGLLAEVAAVVQTLIFCRCPHCGHRFRLREKIANFCPECGKELE